MERINMPYPKNLKYDFSVDEFGNKCSYPESVRPLLQSTFIDDHKYAFKFLIDQIEMHARLAAMAAWENKQEIFEYETRARQNAILALEQMEKFIK